MKIIKVKSLLPNVENIVLFTETRKDDYLYSHQLGITDDVDDSKEVLDSKKYDKLPDESIVSDRTCFYKPVSVKAGVRRS